MTHDIQFDFQIDGFDEATVRLLNEALTTNYNSNDVSADLSISSDYKASETSISTYSQTSKIKAPELSEKTIENLEYNMFDGFKNYFDCFVYDQQKEPLELDLNKEINIKRSGTNIQVIVVGCGGTGSRLVPLLAQQAANRNDMHIMLCDFDIIEHKNLSRQNFYEFEVGENKAKALADRFSMLYGIEIEFSTAKIHNDLYLKNVNSSTDIVVFDCTDNKTARKAIRDFCRFSYYTSGFNRIYLISCGNEKDYGQVHFSILNYSIGLESLSNNKTLLLHEDINNAWKCMRSLHNVLSCKPSLYLPDFLSYNKTFKDNVESVSCVNMDIAEEQSMAINSTIAQLAFNMFFQWMVSKDGLTNMIVYANLSNTFVGQKVNTIEGLLDIYVRQIFGKNIFFEKDSCTANLLNLIKCYGNSHKYKNSEYFTHVTEDINTSILLQKYKEFAKSNKYYNTEQNEYLSNYFNRQYELINEYINNNFNNSNIDFREKYLDYLLFIIEYVNFINVHKTRTFQPYNMYGCAFNALDLCLKTHIDTVINDFINLYKNASGSYKFFEEIGD